MRPGRAPGTTRTWGRWCEYECLQALQGAPGINGSELARREHATTLTDQAAALLAQARTAVARTADAMTSGLSLHECAQLLALLTTCRDALVSTPSSPEA